MVDRHGNITDFNRAAEEITGYSKKDVLGKSHLEIFHTTSDGEECPLFKRSLKQKRKSVASETTIRKKNNDSIQISVTSFPVYDADGKFIGGMELFRDITKLKQRERERKNFLSMFVHDMKNPIITSKGFLTRLLSGKVGGLTKKQNEYVRLVSDELGKVETLVMDFLEFSKYENKKYKPKFKDIDLVHAVKQNIEAMKVECEKKGIKIHSRTEDIIPPVRADETMINRVIGNILNNAVKHSEPGGTVTVVCKSEDDEILVQAINSGSVIPRDQLPYIFDAFHQAGKEKGGSGLGLAISKKIIELHKGKIWADITSDHKTVVSFCLPKK